MRRAYMVAVGLVMLASCGGGGDGGPAPQPGPIIAVPPEVAALDAKVKSDVVRVAPLVANIQSSFVFIMNPGSAPGISVTPDPSPNAPANTFDFSGSHDGNGDGIEETTLSGKVTFAADPNDFAAGFTSLSGQVTIDVSIPGVGHLYHAEVAYTTTMSDTRLSGSGTFTNPVTQTTATLTIPAGAPLVIKPATGASDAMSNACGYSIDGAAQVDVAGAPGTLSAVWQFLSNSASVGIQNVSFRDAGGKSTALPDSSADLRCGSGATIDDWAATFDVTWACLPRESGQFRTTITAAPPDSLSILDEGDPTPYTATLIGGGAHAVRGFFNAGPTGFRYREDFNWTLRKDGGFSQSSVYRYTEGLRSGSGGICTASAKRVP